MPDETDYEIEETTDVPPGRLDAVIAGYNLDHPVKIEKNKQTDGNWTVRAYFKK